MWLSGIYLLLGPPPHPPNTHTWTILFLGHISCFPHPSSSSCPMKYFHVEHLSWWLLHPRKGDIVWLAVLDTIHGRKKWWNKWVSRTESVWSCEINNNVVKYGWANHDIEVEKILCLIQSETRNRKIKKLTNIYSITAMWKKNKKQTTPPFPSNSRYGGGDRTMFDKGNKNYLGNFSGGIYVYSWCSYWSTIRYFKVLSIIINT